MTVRRALAGLLAAAAGTGALVAATGAGDGDDGAPRYVVEMDNAFGLVDGGDVKIAGVRAGTVKGIDLNRRTNRARIDIEVTDRGFGDLRTDASCEARPQSLLGEYFLDCTPGTAATKLPRGGTIPVERTAGTVPLDLIQDIMRRPYRERWSIFLSELGVGLAGRGEDLNETIRRANPALRETDRVLLALERERTTIRDLYRDADQVLVRLRANKRDVGRFVGEARDTARAGAREDRNLARQFALLPTFLRELRPTMNRLRVAALAQRPALQKLSAQAPALTRLLNALGPFAEAARPSTRALARAARAGRPAVKHAAGPVRTLRGAARRLPEVATNLAFILQHIDDPRFAVEKDVRSGRKDGGFTGLEALLRYIWAQSQAINVYTGTSYNLKVALFADTTCGNYANAATARNEANKRCRAWLGPNQPGVTSPDPTASGTSARQGAARARRARPTRDAARAPQPTTALTPTPTTTTPEPAGQAAPATPLPEVLQGLLDDALDPGKGLVPRLDPRAQEGLLDYLMGNG